MKQVRLSVVSVGLLLVTIVGITFCGISQAQMPILPSHTGSWYNPQQDGHGLSVEVLDDGLVLTYWYTYAPDGYAIWVIGMGEASGDTVVMESYVFQGPEFGEWNPNDKERFEFGTMTLKVHNCDELTFSYDSILNYGDTALGSGSIPMVRLSSIDNRKCSESPITGTYLMAGRGGQEVGIGVAIIGPDDRFIALTGSDESSALIRGHIQGSGPGQLTATLDAYRLYGGYIGRDRLSGNWTLGGVELVDESGDSMIGVRDDNGSMRDPSFWGGAFRISDQYTDQSGTIRVSASGVVTGDMFGCSINGDAEIQDYDFDQVWFDIDLTGCSKSGRYQGAGSQNIILLSDGYQGYGWVVE